jgi:hypothetical protein
VLQEAARHLQAPVLRGEQRGHTHHTGQGGREVLPALQRTGEPNNSRILKRLSHEINLAFDDMYGRF